jgi:hypothetical protein
VPVASPAFARRKFSFAGAFAVVVTPVPVGDTTGFSGAFPRRSVFLPERISISDERGYSPKCVENRNSRKYRKYRFRGVHPYTTQLLNTDEFPASIGGAAPRDSAAVKI